MQWASARGIPLENTRSTCLLRSRYHCGNCPFCKVRRTAFEAAGVEDRTQYFYELPLTAQVTNYPKDWVRSHLPVQTHKATWGIRRCIEMKVKDLLGKD